MIGDAYSNTGKFPNKRKNLIADASYMLSILDIKGRDHWIMKNGSGGFVKSRINIAL